MKEELKNAVIDVFNKVKLYDGKKCYLSTYQIAVLLLEDKKIKKNLIDKGYPTNIGGAGEGQYNSLSQTIAKDLARLANKSDTFEKAYFNLKGLEQFSFRDEKGVLCEPYADYNNGFTLFRLKD